MSIVVTGSLVSDAENRRTFDGQAQIVVLVSTGHGLPFEARAVLGADDAAHLKAAALAKSLKRGMPAEVEALEAFQHLNHGIARITLTHLQRVVVAGHSIV